MVNLLRAFDGFDFRALLLNLGLALALVIIVNFGIFAFVGNSRASTQGGPLLGEIPGWFIGLVWTGLFVALATAKWRVQVYLPEPQASRAAILIVALLIFCAIYPIYTAGLSKPIIGLVGNFATAAMAIWVAVAVFRVEPIAALAPIAVVAWVCFASVAIVDQARWLW